MKKLTLLFLLFLGVSRLSVSQNMTDLNLLNAVTGKTLSIGSQLSGKGLIIIFHSPECPFAQMYESRIKALRSKYQSQGFNFILVNPELDTKEETQQALRALIDQSGLNMPYLIDVDQVWVKYFKISKIPEVIFLTSNKSTVQIAYRGAIDNNPQAENSVSERYLDKAIDQILKGEKPIAAQVRPMGCNVRTY
jgi:thiol-disulfide isomerase/thioredoxin